ncbi:MAG: DUF1543 domain-containing protein [Cyanobacteria bacterium]|nr:DUF1543 domain-containing protein [Cyanobacteriota bacterium]
MSSLFLVVLGGRVQAANIELHDVRFVVGNTIEDTLPELRRQWFGARRGLHLDSWIRVHSVDGYRVELRPEPSTAPERLWFVNMGGYDPAQLAELHAFGLFVATSPQLARAPARRQLLPGALQRHKDDLHGVETAIGAADQPRAGGQAESDAEEDDCRTVQSCLALEDSPRFWLHLITDGRQQPLVPDWYGYRPI